MIHRDDLRYTDDVIATLQSNSPVWYIAKALDIDARDVQYHYKEVEGMCHKGTVLPLRETAEPEHLINRDGGTINQYKSTLMFPQDRQYYAERTATQVANEIGKTVDSVKSFCYKRGFKLKRAIMGTRKRTDWPTNPAWYAMRTVIEIAAELKISDVTARKYTQANKIKTRKTYGYVSWPDDAAWFAQRTAVQVAKELNTNADSVRAHCRKNGLTLKQGRKVVVWPTDELWYAERTRREIAKALGIKYMTVAEHVYRKHIVCMNDYRKKR